MGYNVYVEIRNAVTNSLGLIQSVRADLHRIPELSRAEFKTQSYICDFLTARRIPFYKIKTGVVADFKGSKAGGRIALRADIDALPIAEKTDVPYRSTNGNMHACGHDAHTAMLLCVCDLLKNAPPPRPVRAVFQFGEEGTGGAEDMIKGGALDGADEIYGLHVSPDLTEGTYAASAGAVMAGAVEFDVYFTGRSAHCAQSEKGIDAIKPVGALLAALKSFTEHVPHTLLHVGKITAGAARNVVADAAECACTLRYFTDEAREAVMGKLTQFLAETDKMYGTSHRIAVGAVYPPLVNDADAVEKVRAVCPELLPAVPSYTAEDFAFYLQKIPGCFVWLGTKSERFAAPLHSCLFGLREEALLYGVELLMRMIEKQ
jgi:amidohydrolase